MKKKKYIIYILILLLGVGIYSISEYSSYIRLGMEVYKESYSNNQKQPEEKSVVSIENPFYKYIEIVEDKEYKAKDDVETEVVSSIENPPVVSKPSTSTADSSKSPADEAKKDKDTNFPSFDEVASEYYNRFKALENKLTDELNTLIEEAVEDYNNNKYKKLRLAQIYLDKGNKLEAESDKIFSSTLKEMESTLERYSYDKSLVYEIEEYYNNNKKSQKKEIIEKGMAILYGN